MLIGADKCWETGPNAPPADCHFQAADYDAENCPELIRDQIPGTLFTVDDRTTPSFLPGALPPAHGAQACHENDPSAVGTAVHNAS